MKKIIDLKILDTMLYYYLPKSWSDFQRNDELQANCSNTKFVGDMKDNSFIYLHFTDCIFENINFTNMDFSNIGFVRCHFINCSFNNCKFSYTQFRFVRFTSVLWNFCTFIENYFEEITIDEAKMKMSSCKFFQVNINSKNFENKIIFPQHICDKKENLCIETEHQRYTYNEFFPPS